MTRNRLYQIHRGVLFPGAVDRVPAGWLGILDEYLRAVTMLMEGSDFRVQRVVESHGGLDLKWTARPTSVARFEGIERLVILLEGRSLTTCRVCGKRGHGYAVDGDILTLCDDHATGTRIREREQGFARATLKGFVRYDVDTDALVDVDQPAGDD